MKPQKPGETRLSMPIPLSTSPSVWLPSKSQHLLLFLPFGSVSPGYGNGLGAGAFPGLGAQPGEDTWGAALAFREGKGWEQSWGQGMSRGESWILGGGQEAQPLCHSQAWEGE